jgi:D-alanine-D-alanine ligase-like ATP-grasp enzyme
MTVIVLFGGASEERHVSVASAQNVVRTIGPSLAWFWAPNGAVHDVATDQLLAHERPFEIDYVPSRPASWPSLEQALDTLPVEDPVFLLALHGGEGEDGTVQRMMERRGIVFTGSGSEACAAAFDKERAREIVASKVRSAESHQFVQGRKLTVGVVDMGNGPFALPVIDIPEAMRDEAQAAALAAHIALGCEGYSRSDLIAAGDDEIYFLELNTLPGLTTSSLVPQQLRAAGIELRTFLETQIELARGRH